MNGSDPDGIFLKRVFRDPGYFIAAGFGSGLLPKMPGTWGTAVAMVLWLMFAPSLPPWVQLLTVALSFALGVVISARITRELGVEDHQGIVWDEVVGYWLTMLFLPGVFVPGEAPAAVWVWALAGFALFRLFDIVKPWPIRTLERRVSGGLGVMLDDALAGVYAGVVLAFVVFAYARAFT